MVDKMNIEDLSEAVEGTNTGLSNLRANIDLLRSLKPEELAEYRGQIVIVSDGVVYSATLEDYTDKIKELRKQGVDLTSAYTEYVRKPDDPLLILPRIAALSFA